VAAVVGVAVVLVIVGVAMIAAVVGVAVVLTAVGVVAIAAVVGVAVVAVVAPAVAAAVVPVVVPVVDEPMMIAPSPPAPPLVMTGVGSELIDAFTVTSGLAYIDGGLSWPVGGACNE
jgi:hypothetical protein